MTKKVEEAKTKLAEAEGVCEKVTKEEKAVEKEVTEAQKGFTEAQGGERLTISKGMNTEEAELERLRGELHEILQKARVEEVELPMMKQKKKDGVIEEEEEGIKSRLSNKRFIFLQMAS